MSYGRVRRSEFAKIYTQGRKLNVGPCTCYIFPADENKCAYVAGRNVGNAVARNRAKRLMREALKAMVAERGLLPGMIVLKAQPPIRDKKMQDILNALKIVDDRVRARRT